jgi:TolA-binding protein
VEHVERQDEREAELRGDADQLEQRGDQLEEQGNELDEQIDGAREDFERKTHSGEVPGAQEEEGLAMASESHGSDVDPRPGTSENPGAADDEGQATGNPPNDDSPAADDK